MDAAGGRRMMGKTSAPHRKAGKRVRTGQRERVRLIQLLVSLGLFLLVFIGRGVVPDWIAVCGHAVREDTDFAQVFQAVGQALFGESEAGDVWETLQLSIFGEDGRELPAPSQSPTAQIDIVLLGDGPHFGLEEVAQHGILKWMTPTEDPPTPSTQPETSEVVTAVAQVYADNGEKLPSNVSFAFYELGLEETAVPVMGEATSGFGYRISPITGKREFHLALDIAAAKGTKIGAFADGVVEYIGESDEFGLYLKINHANGVSSFYAHCSKLLVRKGDSVVCGQTVAKVGSTGKATGPHLHLTIEKDNIRLDPAHYVDPS